MSFDRLLHTCREKTEEQEDEVLAGFCKTENFQTRSCAEILKEE